MHSHSFWMRRRRRKSGPVETAISIVVIIFVIATRTGTHSVKTEVAQPPRPFQFGDPPPAPVATTPDSDWLGLFLEGAVGVSVVGTLGLFWVFRKTLTGEDEERKMLADAAPDVPGSGHLANGMFAAQGAFGETGREALPTTSLPQIDEQLRATIEAALAVDPSPTSPVRAYATVETQRTIHARFAPNGKPSAIVHDRPILFDPRNDAHQVSFRVRTRTLVESEGTWRYMEHTGELVRSGPTPPPEITASLGCPACGSPLVINLPDGTCARCGEGVANGQFAWHLREFGAASGDRPFLQPLRAHPPEAPPIRPNTDTQTELRRMSGRHPELDIGALEQRAAELTADALRAWNDGDVIPLSGLFTECGLQALQFRPLALAFNGEAERLDGVEIVRTTLVRVRVDEWFEGMDFAVVVRAEHARGPAERLPSPTTLYTTLVVRLIHPAGLPFELENWRCWHVATPQELDA